VTEIAFRVGALSRYAVTFFDVLRRSLDPVKIQCSCEWPATYQLEPD
jgi:hypothetical protein